MITLKRFTIRSLTMKILIVDCEAVNVVAIENKNEKQ